MSVLACLQWVVLCGKIVFTFKRQLSRQFIKLLSQQTKLVLTAPGSGELLQDIGAAMTADTLILNMLRPKQHYIYTMDQHFGAYGNQLNVSYVGS